MTAKVLEVPLLSPSIKDMTTMMHKLLTVLFERAATLHCGIQISYLHPIFVDIHL